jgi:hypothetical protein
MCTQLDSTLWTVPFLSDQTVDDKSTSGVWALVVLNQPFSRELLERVWSFCGLPQNYSLELGSHATGGQVLGGHVLMEEPIVCMMYLERVTGTRKCVILWWRGATKFG